MAVPASNRRWVWFFVTLVLLAAIAISVQVVFSRAQQLRQADLDAAWQLWKEKGPANYRLQFTQRSGSTETYTSWVRGGRVQAVVAQPGRPEEGRPKRRLPPRLYSYYDMPALFDSIDQFLKLDRQPGSPRAYNRAIFDPHDGHLLYYRRSVSRTGQSVEIGSVVVEPEAPGAPLPVEIAALPEPSED
ncbi:MAG: hypothetical protein NZ700_03515 [Gemmataceae bacterium]|nr:hypothetical protein [Gemmataceae bacterium]MDW8263986.1 hypothetical protein [Gemmataceae bacterium]